MALITDEDILNINSIKTIEYFNEESRWQYLISSMSLDMFIHEILMLLSKYADESIRTMGVTVANNMIKLFYAPSFLHKLNDKEARWVITHEFLHIVFHHCTIRMSEDGKVSRLQNIAADMAINQIIPSGTGMLDKPREEIIKPYYPEMYGFPKGLSMEQYFLLLLEKFDPNKPQPQPQEGEQGEEQDGSGEGGQGDEGDPTEDKEGSGQGKDDPRDGKSSKGVGDPTKDPLDAGDLVDSHEGWSDKNGDLIDSIIKDAVENWEKSGKKWGNISGTCKDQILAAQKTDTKWWKILRDYMGHLVSTIRTTTMKRPHRRYGYPYPGTTKRHIDKLLVCGDSSASVSSQSWSIFLSEVNMIAEVHPMDWVVFDVDIQFGPVPVTRRIRQMDVPGRGGTDFQAIFKLAEEGGYKSMVILTDGQADPIEYPKGVKDVIWCIVGGGKPPVDWGKIVYIKENQSLIS
jgi:predicted metal-dependent peptidase